MCDHGEEVLVRVKIPADLACDGVEKWKECGIDACIAPLVQALQTAGIDMRGSCCGHGTQPGSIQLADGSGLLILPKAEYQRFLCDAPIPWPPKQ